MTLDSSWTIYVPTLGLLVAARADSRISPMCGMYAIHMNHSFGSYFFRHLTMEFVRFDGVPTRNEVMSSEEALKATADAMSVLLPGSSLWPHLRLSIPRRSPFLCWGWFL